MGVIPVRPFQKEHGDRGGMLTGAFAKQHMLFTLSQSATTLPAAPAAPSDNGDEKSEMI
jgi:hypothetical protein